MNAGAPPAAALVAVVDSATIPAIDFNVQTIIYNSCTLIIHDACNGDRMAALLPRHHGRDIRHRIKRCTENKSKEENSWEVEMEAVGELSGWPGILSNLH